MTREGGRVKEGEREGGRRIGKDFLLGRAAANESCHLIGCLPGFCGKSPRGGGSKGRRSLEGWRFDRAKISVQKAQPSSNQKQKT